MYTKIITLLALAVVGNVRAQITYVPPQPVWTATVSPVLEGNGVYISPDGAMAVVVSRDTTVTAFSSLDGTQLWQSRGGSNVDAATFGGASFCYGATPYVLISVVEANVSTAIAFSATDGTAIGSFGGMQGTVAGTPVTTEDCQYVLATHNVDGSKGYFSLFSFANPSTPLFTYEHPVIDNEPFGAIGYYWSPVEGNFNGGEFNTNDVFIWSLDTNLNLNNGTSGTPQFFAFQLPTNPNSPLSVTLINGDRDYQAKTAPVITDGGLSMYWSVSRSKVYGWVGDGTGRTDFSTNGVNNFGFMRADPPLPFSSAPLTQPTLSHSSGPDGFVVGTSAANEIWVWDRNFTDFPIVVLTAVVVTSRLLVSPDDAFVYYATPAPDARLYQVSSASLAPAWNVTLSAFGVAGDIVQTKNGARVIVVDTAGSVTAFTVATADEALSPIVAPAPTTLVASSPAPTKFPTLPPATTQVPTSTTPPTTEPTRLPTKTPTTAPSSIKSINTVLPSATPTKNLSNSKAPTSQPTSGLPGAAITPSTMNASRSKVINTTIIAAVVGGVIGSIVLNLLIIGFFTYRKKNETSSTSANFTETPAAAGNGMSNAQNDFEADGEISENAISPQVQPITIAASLITSDDLPQTQRKNDVNYKDQARTVIGRQQQQPLVDELQTHIPIATAVAMNGSVTIAPRSGPSERLLLEP